MWPGQQPPGGEQNPQERNPQEQNPYQQPGQQPGYGYPGAAQPGHPQPGHPQPPGYAQPGPPQPGYAQPPGHPQPGHPQPGYPQPAPYQQPNPYQQPTVEQYAASGQPPGGPRRDDDRRKTVLVAVVAATAVLVTAGVTGFLVLGKDEEKRTTAGGDAKPSQSAPASSEAPPPPVDNPRDGSGAAKPTVPGWKVVVNPTHSTQFDVPPDWEVAGAGQSIGFEDAKAGDGTPVAVMSAPAHYKSKWCTSDTDRDGRQEDTELASVGTKGGQGAKDTAEAAYATAHQWAWAAYAQTEPEGTVKVTKAVPYTTASGLTGHVSTATALNTKKEGKCDTDGKSIAFSFKNAKGDFAIWVLYGATGIKDELPEETVQKILSTVRLPETGQ